MNLEEFMGKSLEEVCHTLDEQNLKYKVEPTQGYKDKEILTKPYVLRATRENDTIRLTTGLFKTTI